MSQPAQRSRSGISVHYDNMVAGVLEGDGIDPARLQANGDLARRFRRAFAAVRARHAHGDLGFLDLPDDRALARRTHAAASDLAGRFDDVVVIGIGGSALGARALRNALLPPRWNERSSAERGGFPRLHVLDNPDPDSAGALLGRLDPARTIFNVVSKSGSTAETLALFLVVRQRLAEALGRASPQGLVVTTDPERGFLRSLARRHGLRSLPVPGNVGGRFSVLSPVGMFPAALAGVDVDAVLAGAAAMAKRCDTSTLTENPAGIVATLLHNANAETNAGVHVFMPYADRLRGFAYWLQQLWAESLGKSPRPGPGTAGSGPTALPAFGAIDQHSLLQLFMEGPRDKVVVFLGCAVPGGDIPIPRAFADSPQVSYLEGRTLHELLDCERVATAEALRRAGRPNLTVMSDRLTAHALGGLFMLFQIAVVYAGALYDVDPMTQPGVELGKVLIGGMLGRSGYDPPVLHPPDPRWQVC